MFGCIKTRLSLWRRKSRRPRLSRSINQPSIQSVELKVDLGFSSYVFQRHYYQPMYTLVGGGMKTLDDTWKPMKDVLSPLVSWVKDKADKIDTTTNSVTTKNGDVIEYEYVLIFVSFSLELCNFDPFQISGCCHGASIKL